MLSKPCQCRDVPPLRTARRRLSNVSNFLPGELAPDTQDNDFSQVGWQRIESLRQWQVVSVSRMLTLFALSQACRNSFIVISTPLGAGRIQCVIANDTIQPGGWVRRKPTRLLNLHGQLNEGFLYAVSRSDRPLCGVKLERSTMPVE